MWHIHVDGTYVSLELNTALLAMGLYTTNFCGHPPGFDHFEPNTHLTKKFPSQASFAEYWEKAEALIAEYPDFTGYLEGEEVSEDVVFSEKSYNPNIPVPFHITRRRLRGVEYGEEFRESELHLTLDKDASDTRLITALLDAGLYGAYLPKRDHTALVLTAQGARRAEIVTLKNVLQKYLEAAGGAVRATLKEEVAIKYRLFGNITHLDLPEVIDTATYF